MKNDNLCINCKNKMFFTGKMYMSFPARFEHKCEKCNSIIMLDKMFPNVNNVKAGENNA